MHARMEGLSSLTVGQLSYNCPPLFQAQLCVINESY